MLDILGLLIVAGLLLGALPQFLGYAIGTLARRKGTWWPVILAIVIPPGLFYILATQIYGTGSITALQGAGVLDGRIEVTNHRLGLAVHAAVATLLQSVTILRSR